MLKKSDIQELFTHLPDEFEAEDLISAIRHIENPIFTPEEIAKLDEAHEEFEREGGVPMEEAIERIHRWQAERLKLHASQ